MPPRSDHDRDRDDELPSAVPKLASVVDSSTKPILVAECPPEQGVPLVTPYSQIGTPPEHDKFSPRKVFGYLIFAGVVIASLVIVIALLPLLIAASLVRRVWAWRNCSKFRRSPESLKIAVIGGGWSGVQIVSRLRELGVQNITGFEKLDDLGGTWHQGLSYHGLQIHGAMWATSFDKYPYNSKDEDANDGKVLNAEIRNYIHRFADHKYDVLDCYKFNSKVVKVMYDSSTNHRKATLVVEEGQTDGGTSSRNTESLYGPYDFVVYASQSSAPNIPNIPGRSEFRGDIFHSQQFKTKTFHKILEENKKVVIVGGSKAACDLVLCFQRAGYDAFEWVYRKPYLFWKYETIFHNRSLWSIFRGTSNVLMIFFSLVSTKLSCWILWWSNSSGGAARANA